ncbi:hypothetical protein MCOR13_009507 [Pyricularia oryzae]|nr:hypothetical protein MCOR13_009507 [Pyricularia oryzae]
MVDGKPVGHVQKGPSRLDSLRKVKRPTLALTQTSMIHIIVQISCENFAATEGCSHVSIMIRLCIAISGWLTRTPRNSILPSPIDASPRLQTAPYTYAWHYDPCNAENLVWLAWAGDRTKSHRLEKEVRSQICRNEGALGVFHIFADTLCHPAYGDRLYSNIELQYPVPDKPTTVATAASGPSNKIELHLMSTTPTVFLPILDVVNDHLAVNSVFVFLVIVVVSLRVVGRCIGPGLGWDDALVVAAMPLGIAMHICSGFFAPIGNGYNLAEHPQLIANVPFILQLTFGMQLVYVTLLALTKASMLCFFLRVFSTPWMKRASIITLAVIAVWWVSYVCACIFICDPVSGQWTGVGKCGQYITMIQSLIATNAIGDVVIMMMPMKQIWSLKMRKTDKVGVSASFLLGTACVVIAIFRLIYISTVDLNSNVTGTMSTTILLFTLEPNLAILCISIPMLRPFYVLYKKRVGSSRLTEDKSGYNNGPSGNGYAKDVSNISSNGIPSRSAHGTGAPTTNWELDDYKTNKVTVTTTGDGASIDKPSVRPSGPLGDIRVDTEWQVSRV